VSSSSTNTYLRELRGVDGKLGGANGTKSEEGKERGKKECGKHVLLFTIFCSCKSHRQQGDRGESEREMRGKEEEKKINQARLFLFL
jgi:hypothetical protein